MVMVWWATVHRVTKSQTVEKQPTMHAIGFPGSSDGKKLACVAGDLGWSLAQEDPLEKEMAIHYSVLA